MKKLAVILAGGKSSRFKTSYSKQSAFFCGTPVISHIQRQVSSVVDSVVVVLGPHNKEELSCLVPNSSIAIQAQANGTAGAIAAANHFIPDKGVVLIVNGDMPLVSSQDCNQLLEVHAQQEGVTFAVTRLNNSTGYGRILEHDNMVEIREENECTDAQRAITLVNVGIYVVSSSLLKKFISLSNKVGTEWYLTDIVSFAQRHDYSVQYVSVDPSVSLGVNTLQQLAEVEAIAQQKIIARHMKKGVRFIRPESSYVEFEVEIEKDVVIGPGAVLTGNTVIQQGARIEAYSVINDSIVGKYATVGPFAHIRGGAELKEQSQIGNFVEVKKSIIGPKSKAKHLAYIGDAYIGAQSNIGAGTITCNYDGIRKSKTIIGDNVLIGSNSSLIAPVTIENESYVAAGSTITRNVEKGSLAVARSRQENKRGWVTRYKSRATLKQS